jgi:hypothetical protein
MADLWTMMLVDLSIVITMLVLSYLSRKMGDALKIPPYYRVLYATALLMVAASGMDMAIKEGVITASPLVSLVVRGCAGIAAFGVCLRYWNWLFSEFFGA